ncbi:hypothetical protein PUNSTDRAFT_52392 [Punctularia strigosozonata HHB-11173 SS5]|uniref:uncharacterized protein n=1 Tax=Punctularia strigosozonata (strain HHB-11173) TaxID=741275 RepID=UPI0004417804|nr:uncharacterized protein PUNSTDRAFT_52392 [Punctularia strigosozonata HHB-11173 SS5]EIN08947.1 hypothetical protein PUNSTDRAFT_52392 [Punctularia strigosozonata HHB-11173 SS5]
MSGQTPFSNAQAQYPALYLYALNDSFVPKHISLSNNQHVKIGRQTSAKTVPAERNGYFDSKVLSRQHAEVWEEGGKIYIKDVKSSNGTFINGERLSPEGVESEPYEIKTDDIVEFGIDIVSEDNKTIIHHKVAARAVCIFSEADAQAALRAEHAAPPSGPSSAAFNFTAQQNNGTLGQAPNGQASNFARRPQIQGMGGLGGSMRPPGKSGLTFEHILNRLQGELQKSRETGAELHSLTGAMGEVGDTLGGGLPPPPAYPSHLPPVRPAQSQQHQHSQSEPVASASASSSSDRPQPAALNDIQAQLRETQTSLAAHVEKIRALEETLAEHAALKRDMNNLRELIEDRRRVRSFSPTDSANVRPMSPEAHRTSRDHHDSFDESAELDDDARSIASTVMPHELERVDEVDEDEEAEAERIRMRMDAQAEEEAEAHRRELAEDGEEEVEEQRRRLGRPRTPEPSGLGMDDDHEESGERGRSKAFGRLAGPTSPSSSKATAADHADRLEALAAQLESALEMSRNLQSQHAAAQSTIRELESKVGTLESLVRESLARQSGAPTPATPASVPDAVDARPKEGLTEILSEWKKSVEVQWADVREEWGSERERLRKAREEWEARLQAVEQGVDGVAKKVEDGLAEAEAKVRATLSIAHHLGANGDAKGSSHGLVTPPSPRSLSADSNKPRNRRRNKSGRGRSGSRDAGAINGSGSTGSVDLSSSEQSYGQPIASHLSVSPAKTKLRPRSPWGPEGSSSDDDEETRVGDEREQDATKYPTPKSSWTGTEPSNTAPGTPTAAHHPYANALALVDLHNPQVSRTLATLVVGIAAVAVVWRVKPDTLA